MIAITGLFSRGTTPAYGITTLVFGSAVGGWVFYLMYKYIYQYEYPGADRSKKPGMGKTLLILTGRHWSGWLPFPLPHFFLQY